MHAMEKPMAKKATKATLLRARERFIEHLALTCSITKAAKFAKVNRSTVYGWRDEEPEFAAAWERALLLGADKLEDEAIRRAADGMLKPIYQNGIKVGSVREYSDTLMCLLLKAHKPEKFRERSEVRHDATANLAEAMEAASVRARS